MNRSAFAAAVAVTLTLTGCATEEPTADVTYPAGPVTMTAGADEGSGFDLTIRSVVDALQKERIVDIPLPVQNRPGGSGADFLASMVRDHKGADDQIAVTSLSMMVNQVRGTSDLGYTDVTMIARLITEYYMVVTPTGSPLGTLGDVIAAIRTDPASVTVGAANDDELPFGLLVAAAGGDPSTVRYDTREGGGEQIAALADGTVDVAVGGVSEFVDQVTAGNLTALGVLAEDRLPGLDVPTAREQGLDVTLSNWRGLYGPPDMPASAVDYWQNALAAMVETPTWKKIAEQRKFTTTFMIGAEFQDFLASSQEDVETGYRAAPR